MDIDKWNDRSQKDALRTGRLTFSRMVVDQWPACVQCGFPLRNLPDAEQRQLRGGKLVRVCKCPGVTWVQSYTTFDWERCEPTETADDG